MRSFRRLPGLRDDGKRFRDRVDAGRRLGAALQGLSLDDPLVVGLPRGGVAVAAEVARVLHAPLDVVVVRKIGAPLQPELAIGAVGEGGTAVFNDRLVRSLGLDGAACRALAAREEEMVAARMQRYRPSRPGLDVCGREVVVVDDGLATGATARAACQVLRARRPARLVLAVPVAPPDTVELLRREVDEVVALQAPPDFMAVGQWYTRFDQTTDDEVVSLLESAPVHLAVLDEPAGPVVLPAELVVPAGAQGLVVFAHGSGSGRRSPRNQAVAEGLRGAGFGTLLFDLLTPAEGADRSLVFDIELLARRLDAMIDWVRAQPAGGGLPVGLFGASTGAAAALRATAGRDDDVVRAVVSRGGRPDLAGPVLRRVRVPTLLVVGGADEAVLGLNRAAADHLAGVVEIAVVPGAGHLFAEPGTMEEVTRLAADWFTRHVGPS